MSNPVTIGVAIRFEEPTKLNRFLLQLAATARQLDRLTESEVIFCLNGAADTTRHYVDARAETLDRFELPFVCIESQPGKIKAHQAVAKTRRLQGYLLFVDADVEFKPETFATLYKALSDRDKAWACCANVRALPSLAKGGFGAFQNSYYRNRHRLPPRRHLHGRCFLLREWLDEFSQLAAQPLQTSPDCQNLAHLGLERGPSVDDIHYSRVLVHRFGPEAIVQVRDAVVRFHPPESPAELYRDSFRTEFELARLARLFPEHAELEHQFFAKDSPLRRCLSAVPRAGLGASAYLALELCMRAVARNRILHNGASPKQWHRRGQDHHAT